MFLRRAFGSVSVSVGLLLLTGCYAAQPPVDIARTRKLAKQDADRRVVRVEEAIKRERARPPETRRYDREAVRVTGTEVMSLGGSRSASGVSLVVRVHGETRAVDTSGETTDETVKLPVCYAITVEVDSTDDRVDEVACPEAPPLTVSTDPRLPRFVEYDLRRALPAGAAATESAVRAAVDGLDLEPLVTRQVAASGGIVGVALRASQYDCVLARVHGARIEVWRPARVQLEPGELGCTAGTAVAGQGQRPPH